MKPTIHNPQVVRDYRTWRVGRITPRGRKIVRCPCCDQKGEYVKYREGEYVTHQVWSDGFAEYSDASRDICSLSWEGAPQ